MNLLIRILLLVAVVSALWRWQNGLTLILFLASPLALVLIEQAGEPKPCRPKRFERP
jgi:hypothetical protein